MFNQVLDNFRQAAEATVHLQQEMVKKWITLWPGIPVSSPSWEEQVKQFQKKGAETLDGMFKQQREVTEAYFEVGLKNIEKAFEVGASKSPEELRAKSLELWQQCFDNLRKVYEAQMRAFEMTMEKWAHLTKRG
jgi:hypothetical protein